MPEFLADPSVLTKEKLKSELLANNVSLPGGEQRKDVYVQLYLQHLTARNALAPGPGPGPPDFSSDEEREPTPLGARGRGDGAAASRKATKKTDKPRPEEKDDLDVTELSNEDLQEQLVKYGVNPGPIVATTRKVYEKKLLKLMEQGPELKSPAPLPTPTISSSAENTRQNGNNDSDQYSDNEEDPKLELKLEKREPLKSKTKAPITLKQRRLVEHNQVETTAQLPIDDAVMSESTPIAETILTSSNETLQVVNRVPGNFKHATPIQSISEFSDLSRRTSKKPLMTTEVVEKTHTEERRVERDILKEMFPYEASTPTGISASCRRPIKGAASRPIEFSDFRVEESFSSKYVPKYGFSTDMKAEKATTKKERSIPMWIKILLFVVVSVFLFLVYQTMETNQGNPFSKYLKSASEADSDSVAQLD
ncbi:PREDICTED: thymopoietin isoform X8 [Gavialis gangeticus]|uniref:thymopoietin isoform X8 n=1 Tax=Gavialis gangeticus TaxID=94835 RepID=UPI00092F7A6F|nr:PREDICTED: thymopoietin isoform X8 [Gavialis gangeticus]